MKRIIFILLVIPNFLFAQVDFKPGSTYPAATELRDIYGTIWKTNVRIGIAVSPPSQGYYYSYVRTGPPPITPGTSSGEVYAINIQDVGVKPSNTPQQNSDSIERFLNSIPEGNTPSIYAPYGNYKFARTISIYRRPIHLFGDNGTIFGNSTKFYFPPATTGIVISRGGTSIQETIIEKICVIGDKSQPGENDGFTLLARAKIRDCTAKGFVHYGFSVWANMEEGNDASGSIIESCHALENGLDGFFAGRTDANAITFFNCDSRDNGRYGFNDDSFLGNYFITCMAHNNAGGHWFVRDKGNARTSLISCYGEMGSPVNQLSPKTTVTGGFLANGYTLDGTNIIYQ